MIKADPFAQLKLLDVQAVDSRLAQLRHQRATLPQTAEIARLGEERTGVDNQARDARIEVEDLQTEQRKADADVEQVKARRVRDQQRIDTGQITNPKDLERLQHEMVSLERRIASLEDTELEIMEKLEEAQGRLDGFTVELEKLDATVTTLSAERDQRWAEIDAEIAAGEAERAPLTEDLPTDLLALYDKIRDQRGGVGAAAIHRRECQGCRLSIDNAELAVIRKAGVDTVLRCEECSRILVRTGESGL